MKISELISSLNDIQDEQGDCDVLIDVPERDDFCWGFEIRDKWYSPNYSKNNLCFLIINSE
jgi:hypothetical protein